MFDSGPSPPPSFVLTRMSNVALHCLTVTVPPSVLQLISGFFLLFFFAQSLLLHESKGTSSVCGTLASLQIPHFTVFLLLDSSGADMHY